MNLSDLKIALLEAKRQRKIASPHKGTLGNQYVKWDNEVGCKVTITNRQLWYFMSRLRCFPHLQIRKERYRT